jgi:hypothetical protein
MSLDVGPQATWRVLQAVLLGRPHGDELPPPRQEGAQLFRLRLRKGAGQRAHGLGKVGHSAGIEGICFGSLPGGFRTVPYRPGIDHNQGEGRCRQRGHHGALGAPCSFEHNELRSARLEAWDQGANPWRIMRDCPAFACGAQGNIKLCLRNIDTNKDLRGRHHHS